MKGREGRCSPTRWNSLSLSRRRTQFVRLLPLAGPIEHQMLIVIYCRTITNWVREFEKWVPHMRVVSGAEHQAEHLLMEIGHQVPYYGEASCKLAYDVRRELTRRLARKIISKYELYRKGQQGKAAGLRA